MVVTTSLGHWNSRRWAEVVFQRLMKLCEYLILLTLVSFIVLGLELLLLENVFRHISEYAKGMQRYLTTSAIKSFSRSLTVLALSLHPNVTYWICNFLTQRAHVNGELSSLCHITRSITQGSGTGPTLYVVMESDLRPKSSNNILF